MAVVLELQAFALTWQNYADLEKLLVDIGAINPNDHRLSKTTNKDKIEDSRIRSKAGAEDNDDDDWD